MDKRIAVRPAIGTGLILLIPLVMTLIDHHKAEGDGWRWSPLDFVVMGALLFAAGLSYAVLARKLRSKTQRALAGLLVFVVVVAIWVELAVGGISQLITWLFG